MSDLLAQMVYEGNVKVLSDDGKKFTFDSPEGVAWLQTYVGMVKAETVDNTVLTTTDDRVGLNAFIAGGSPFYATGPNLARQVKDQNATLYGNLGMVQQPLGKSNVSGKGLMSISVKRRHQVPQRLHGPRPVLHQPAGDGGVQQAGRRSTRRAPRRIDDPFFSSTPSAIEDSARPLAEGHHRDLRRHRADDPRRRPTSTRSSARRSSPRCSATARFPRRRR